MLFQNEEVLVSYSIVLLQRPPVCTHAELSVRTIHNAPAAAGAHTPSGAAISSMRSGDHYTETSDTWTLHTSGEYLKLLARRWLPVHVAVYRASIGERAGTIR
jgi:hypothetical protein